jgi:hypothetical protein
LTAASSAFGDTRKGVAGHSDEADRGRPLVERPDRLEAAAHVGLENIDQHDFECRGFKRANTCLTVVSDGYLETLALKTDFNGPANHWVVIDHENTRHLEASHKQEIRNRDAPESYALNQLGLKWVDTSAL